MIDPGRQDLTPGEFNGGQENVRGEEKIRKIASRLNHRL